MTSSNSTAIKVGVITDIVVKALDTASLTEGPGCPPRSFPVSTTSRSNQEATSR